jgi:hypothetical protein
MRLARHRDSAGLRDNYCGPALESLSEVPDNNARPAK